MDPNQRALTPIQFTVGAMGQDASALGSTTLPNHNFLDVTRVGRNAELQNTQQYNPQELIGKFNILYGDRSGINPFAILAETQGKKFHSIG